MEWVSEGVGVVEGELSFSGTMPQRERRGGRDLGIWTHTEGCMLNCSVMPNSLRPHEL